MPGRSVAAVAAPAVLLLILAVVHPVAAAAGGNVTVILYGTHTCPHCRATWAAIEELVKAGVVKKALFLEVAVRRNAQAYAEVFKKWMLMRDVASVYSATCKAVRLCLFPGVPLVYVNASGVTGLVLGELAGRNETLNWLNLIQAMEKGEAVTLTGGKVRFRSVACISLPGCDRLAGAIREALAKANATWAASRLACLGGVAICVPLNETITPVIPAGASGKQTVTSVKHATATPVQRSSAARSLPQLIPVLVGLAALDAINPCFLTLYALTVAAVAGVRGRRGALEVGAAVALGVFTGYYLLGLGLVQAAAQVPYARYALAAAAIAIGVFTLLKETGLVKMGEECAVCKLAAKLGIGSASMTAWLGYLFGLTASLTLLPCSSGPYAIAAIYLSGLSPTERLLGLLVYNLVFIAPILAMAAAASLVAAYAKAEKVLRYAAGPLLIILGILVIIGYT